LEDDLATKCTLPTTDTSSPRWIPVRALMTAVAENVTTGVTWLFF